jgi:uncharacterized membrane protein (DUF106 family)
MSFLDTIFSPFLALNPLIAILILSALIAIFMVLVYKWMTDQKLMKELKTELAASQKKMKELKDNPKKLMELQKKAMESNMKYMMQSFKPTLVTFIPIILIFAWLNSHMGYYPLVDGQQFTIDAQFNDATTGVIEMIEVPKGIELLNGEKQNIADNKAEWALKGTAGDYTLSYRYGNATLKHSLIITKGERSYAKPVLLPKDLGLDKSSLKGITISNTKIRPFGELPVLSGIPWLNTWGWLGTYILFSLIFSIVFRKLFKVY